MTVVVVVVVLLLASGCRAHSVAAGWRVTVEAFRLFRATASPTGLRDVDPRLRASESFVNVFPVFLYDDRPFARPATLFLNFILAHLTAVLVINRRNSFFSRYIFCNRSPGRAVGSTADTTHRRNTFV
jgi:hypothetical protein